VNLAIEDTRVNERADYIPAALPADDADSCDAVTIPAALGGLRLDQALAKLFPQHSRSRLQGWLRDGYIRVDGASPDARRKVCGGESVEIDAPPPPEIAAELPEAIPLDVVFEDAHVLVINKPVGLVVHPGSGNWSGTLLNALLHHDPALAAVPRAGIVHRLDKDTSGLMVVARTAPWTRRSVAILRSAREWRSSVTVARLSPTISSSSALRAARWSSAGSIPGVRTRSGCTWRSSVIRSWVIRSMASGARAMPRWTPFRARRCMLFASD
jgi:hypothetical protein